MLATLQTINDKARTTGKLPPFTAKAKAALEAEARPIAEAALAAGGFTVRALEVEARKSSSPRHLPGIWVTFVDFTGTEEQHKVAARHLKAQGIGYGFAEVEQAHGYSVRKVQLFYPHL